MSIERRIWGSPGTGKTHKLIHEVIPEYVKKYGTKGIIVVSYTRSAAAELISRMGGQIQTFNDASDPELGIDGIVGTKIMAGTLHSLTFHTLHTPKIATGKEVIDEFCSQYKYGKALISNNRLERIEYLRNKLFTIDDIEPGNLKILWRVWSEYKKEHKLLDFTDLIENCLKNPFPPKSVHVMICDESQDFTPLQIKLLRHWNKHLQTLVLSGDDDQSLYGFIGADPSELIRKDLEDTEIITEVLTKSHRLPRQIHQYAKNYIEKIEKREAKDFTHNGLEGKIENLGVDISHEKCFQTIIREAKDRTVMIIAPCDYMLNGIIDKMKKHGVLFSNKYKLEDNRWNPISKKIEAVERSLRGSKDRADVFLWVRFILKQYLNPEYAKKKIIKPTDLEGTLFYRNYLKEILLEEKFLEFEDLAPEDRLKWFIKHISEKDKKQFDYIYKVLNGKYKDLKEITVSTIHGVKGREAQVVILCSDKSPAMEKSTVFDKSSIIRQMYVGITRASERLYFTKPTKLNHGVKFRVASDGNLFFLVFILIFVGFIIDKIKNII